jgi:PIN domain nuclease of toxin-antitoxin system
VRYLLDTHVALALANETPDELPSAMRALLAEPERSFVVSVASLWEIAIKSRLGKLPLKWMLEELPAQLAILGIEFVDVRLFHTLIEVDSSLLAKDPFDRMLIAVAQVEQCEFVTLDKALRDHPLAWKPASA